MVDGPFRKSCRLKSKGSVWKIETLYSIFSSPGHSEFWHMHEEWHSRRSAAKIIIYITSCHDTSIIESSDATELSVKSKMSKKWLSQMLPGNQSNIMDTNSLPDLCSWEYLTASALFNCCFGLNSKLKTFVTKCFWPTWYYQKDTQAPQTFFLW